MELVDALESADKCLRGLELPLNDVDKCLTKIELGDGATLPPWCSGRCLAAGRASYGHRS